LKWFWFVVYIYAYVSVFLVRLFSVVVSDFVYGFVFELVWVFVFFLLAYVVCKCFDCESFTSCLGFRREGFLESLVLSSASFAFPNLLLVVVGYLVLG